MVGKRLVALCALVAIACVLFGVAPSNAAGQGFVTDGAVEPLADKGECIRLFEDCRNQGWYGPCDDCLHKCIAQHEWDFNLCWPRRR